MIGGAELDKIARATYMRDWGFEKLPNLHTPPVWENVSEEVKEFVRAQVRCTIHNYEKFRDR